MSNFSSKTKYVEARPRREKKLGRGGSVISVAASSGGSGVSKSYVDSNFVTLATEQTISGAKDFVGGIKVNGMPITYNAELGVWEFVGDLFVTGNFAWGSSIDGFKPSTVMDAVRVDGSTIIKKKDSNGDWYLWAPGGGSGGSGGGLTLGDVVSYLSDNDYTTKTDVNSLIASALVGYATRSWVGDNYLATSGGTITGASGALTIARRDADQIGILFTGASGDLGLIGFSSSDTPAYIKYDGNAYPILHSGNYTNYFTKSNIKSTLGISDWALAETKPTYTTAEVGAYTGNGSSIPNGEDLANLQAGSYWVYENLGAASAVKLPYSSLVVLGNSYYSPQMNISHNAQQAYIRGVYNTSSGNSVSDWHELAFIDSNVASATKLATPRTIWGQSFDGTGNVDGQLDINGLGTLHRDDSALWLNYGGANNNQSLRVCGYDIAFYYGIGSNLTRAITITNGGDVTIGGSTADAKLHIHGTYAVSDVNASGLLMVGESNGIHLAIDGNDIQAKSNANTLSTLYLNGWGGDVIINESNAGKVGVGTPNPTTKFHIHYSGGANGMTISRDGDECSIGYVSTANSAFIAGVWGNSFNIWRENHGTIASFNDGGATINGNLLVNGNVSWFSHSQRSLKNIVSEQGLSLAQLERIKPIKFYWKDGRDMVLHVGGVADVFAEVLPEVVARNLQDILCLNYVDAAFYVGASLIAPVLDHERRITKGEAEQEAQKKETAKLKRELEEVKGKLNQLVA